MLLKLYREDTLNKTAFINPKAAVNIIEDSTVTNKNLNVDELSYTLLLGKATLKGKTLFMEISSPFEMTVEQVITNQNIISKYRCRSISIFRTSLSDSSIASKSLSFPYQVVEISNNHYAVGEFIYGKAH